VKRVVEVGGARKPEESDPANPDCVGSGSREVVPPTRVAWCQRYPELTQALMSRRVYEHLVTGCEHETDAHCPVCADRHILDLIQYCGRYF